ncbi:putative ABC transport system permease protein [Catalinimonas alkaloidigena]|uniref:Putative ABC transport system permease protein n=1 Tax=Catalinimonas alkaloidigena TaxID=1075417 RepID=A0A1G9UXI2_9BACT|nr:ABC transporter permease [Catalinimonas alkaloidigena]SDM64684.1 putative ABC transport system permease protein [Catalinimonas alkaloidigena]
MLRHSLKVAFRTLCKHPSFSLILLVGLTLGLTFALVIGMVVRYERSFDRFHTHADRIYRVVRVASDATAFHPGVPFSMPATLSREVPALEAVTAIDGVSEAQVGVYGPAGTITQRFQEMGCAYVDTAFFHLFDFAGTGMYWLAGDSATALQEPYTVVLTQTMAAKYFSERDALGQSLHLVIYGRTFDATVTGIVTDFPAHTDLPFTLLVSHATLDNFVQEYKTNWVAVDDEYTCFVRLREGTMPAMAEAQIQAAHTAHVPAELAQRRTYRLQPLAELHTDRRFGNYHHRTISPEMLGTLTLVGGFILLMACINFINLSTARALTRAREVGLRKVLGSAQLQLVEQLLGETFLLVLPAALLAILSSAFFLQQAGDLTHVEDTRSLFLEPATWMVLVGLVVGVTLLAGFYPALVLSGFSPLRALKKQRVATHPEEITLRRSLVVLQFFLALVLVMGTGAVVQQRHYLRDYDLGFDQESVLLIPLPTSTPETLTTLRNQWEALASVEAVSFSLSSPAGVGGIGNWEDMRRPEAEPEEPLVFQINYVDDQYLSLYQIPLRAGRNLLPTDSSDKLLVSESLAQSLGFRSLTEAVGQTVLHGVGPQRATIIGVMQNYQSASLHEEAPLLALAPDPRFHTASLKLAPGSRYETIQETVAQVKSTWTEAFPEAVFDFSFLDETIEAYYQEETRLSILFNLFTGVALFIACLGLLGLASYTALQRTKEIGIRKVLGASVTGILIMLSRDYLRLLLIAFVMAVPVANYCITEWLQGYPYQVPRSGWLFALPGFGVLLVALLTVSAQSMRAAYLNPVETLRQE